MRYFVPHFLKVLTSEDGPVNTPWIPDGQRIVVGQESAARQDNLDAFQSRWWEGSGELEDFGGRPFSRSGVRQYT